MTSKITDNNHERIKVTFDKKELKARAGKFTFLEARRHAVCIYKALIQELLEDGCLTSAKYFERLAAKENDYYVNNVIRDRVMDYPEFLMSIYDNIKMAEKSALMEQCEGMPVTFNLLHQIVSLMDLPQYANKFNWLRRNIYEIVANICDKLGTGKRNAEKPIAQIYLKYANILSNENESLAQSLNYYEKAIGLVQTNKWIYDSINTDTHSGSYLHTVVVHHYVEALLKFGKTIAPTDYLQAVAWAHKAQCILTQVGRNSNNLHQFVNVQMHMAEFYVDGENYSLAFNVLANISTDMPKIDKQHYEQLALRLHLNKGICYTNLNQKNEAMDHLRQALLLSQKLHLKSIEAQVYINIGKMYLHEGATQRNLAKRAFLHSKRLYENLGDLQNRKKAIYLLAKVMTVSVFPLFMDLMKSSGKYCEYFHLRQWKNQLKPFWQGQHLRDETCDELQCLLEEFEEKPHTKDLLQI